MNFQTLGASFNNSFEDAFTLADNGVLALIEVCLLVVAALLCLAPMLTDAAFDEILPSYCGLFFQGGVYDGQ